MEWCQVCDRDKRKVYAVKINTDNMMVCAGCIGIIRDVIADLKARRILSR